MKTCKLVRTALLLLVLTILSGCIWAIEDDGYRGGGSHERDHGGPHRGENHERR